MPAQPKAPPSLDEAMARIDALERLVGKMHVPERSLMGLAGGVVDNEEESTSPLAPADLLGELIAKRGT